MTTVLAQMISTINKAPPSASVIRTAREQGLSYVHSLDIISEAGRAEAKTR